MFEIKDLTRDNIIALKAYDKIKKEDYEKLEPLLDKTKREDKPVRLFVEIGDLSGATGQALMKDIAMYFKHARNMEKVAVVGENKYFEKSWAKVADPFMKADVKYFPKEEQVVAENWIRE